MFTEMHQLGRALQLAGLNEFALAELFGRAWTSDDIPLVLDRYRAGDPRAALARVFVLGERVACNTLPVDVRALAEAGLVDAHDGWVSSRVRITPFAGILVVHEAEVADEGFVTGVNAASRTLATLTVRDDVERVLDVGTGSGVEALLAARHATTVVATDINPRALEFASLNARLNGLSLDIREGSLFDPVVGETFDLIVANPPFVVSPDTDFVFRDSGLPGDAICREVVRGAAAHLRPGGFATVLCNWICRSPDERWEPLAGWVEGLSCDALLFSHGVIEPLRYASRWNEPHRKAPEAYARAVGRWLDYYEREGIVGIGIGAVILRGRDGPGWVRGFAAPTPAAGAAGEHIRRIFAGADRLERLASEEELLDGHFELVRGHRLEQALVFRDDYEIAGVAMSLEATVGLVAEIEPHVLPFLFELTPERTLAEVAAAAELDAADVARTVRRLLELGMLTSCSS
ncbi:MAG TPA: methyltransferase [Gaiellaceae bacterium]|nr:methyltransferase [Gaiellaceae bacterium]